MITWIESSADLVINGEEENRDVWKGQWQQVNKRTLVSVIICRKENIYRKERAKLTGQLEENRSAYREKEGGEKRTRMCLDTGTIYVPRYWVGGRISITLSGILGPCDYPR